MVLEVYLNFFRSVPNFFLIFLGNLIIFPIPKTITSFFAVFSFHARFPIGQRALLSLSTRRACTAISMFYLSRPFSNRTERAFFSVHAPGVHRFCGVLPFTPVRIKKNRKHIDMSPIDTNRATRTRTLKCWNQNPVPYHLAIALCSRGHFPTTKAIIIQAEKKCKHFFKKIILEKNYKYN